MNSPLTEPMRVVALAGNPNAGKTSLFNALTGENQHVGNYPGVTVDKVTGRAKVGGRELAIVDLPGTYSLTAYSLEEVVTRDFVLKEKPNLVIDVMDSTNLERNLYLLLQFQELGVPVVGALNMSDEADRKGIHIDVPLLSKLLGIPLVRTVGTRGVGKEQLLKAAWTVLDGKEVTGSRHLNYGPELEEKHDEISLILSTDPDFVQKYSSHWIAIKLLEEDIDAVSKVRSEHHNAQQVLDVAAKAVQWVSEHFGKDSEVVVGEQRYAYIRGAVTEAVTIDPKPHGTRDMTDLVDSVVLNRFLGVPVFFAVMLGIYALTFLLGNPLSDLVQSGFARIGGLVTASMPEGILRDFLVNGVIGGVGGVLSFFPIVVLLFLGLSFVEDVGYMARAAFVMDKFLHIFGLHGRSFIPLMVSTGCAVPGVMSARTLVNPKDRTLTVLIAPLLMCGAKTPVVAMLSGAFFPKHAALVFWALWLFGWALAFCVGFVFRKTLFRGDDTPFVMELPPYRLPTPRGVASHMWHKSWSYLKKAWTFILSASIVIWALLTFPRTNVYSRDYDSEIRNLQANATVTQDTKTQASVQGKINDLQNQKRVEEAKGSVAGRVGSFIQPAMKYAGFDWKVNVALFSGVAAKEVIISTMGIVYGLGETNADSEGDKTEVTPLKTRISSDPSYSPLSALSLMIFVMIYIPCIATLAVTRKELGSMKWVGVSVGYTLLLAYGLSVLVYQVGKIILNGGFGT
jgi:ferrous iron transport protein B